MTNLIEKKFINEELGIEIESFIDKKLRIWFKAKKVAQILSYKNREKAIKRHVSENHKRIFLFVDQHETHGQQNDNRGSETRPKQNDTRGKYCIFIDEAGFYELVFKSRLPIARIFREWVFSKVLPPIRKYGYYKMIDSKRKKRVIFEGKKFYKHPVFGNYAASKNGDILSLKSEKILKMEKNKGYLRFRIFNKKLEKRTNYSQHRFVYEVFKGAIPRCLEIDHINSIKSDNRIKNLQLLTHKQNVEKSNNKPIISTNIETGEEIRFISIKTASNKLNIDSSFISDICRKRKHHKTAKSNKDEKNIHLDI